MGSVIEPIRDILHSCSARTTNIRTARWPRALEVVGERWTLLIVRDAFYGVRRFNDFQAHLDIPKAVLSDRLAGLVDEDILERRPDPGHAGRHLYELTPAGRDLWPAMNALLAWGDRHRQTNSRVFRHAACGTLLDDAGYCRAVRRHPRPRGHRDRAPSGAWRAGGATRCRSPYGSRTACSSRWKPERRYAAEETSPGTSGGAASGCSSAAARASLRLRRLSRWRLT